MEDMGAILHSVVREGLSDLLTCEFRPEEDEEENYADLTDFDSREINKCKGFEGAWGNRVSVA